MPNPQIFKNKEKEKKDSFKSRLYLVIKGVICNDKKENIVAKEAFEAFW